MFSFYDKILDIFAPGSQKRIYSVDLHDLKALDNVADFFHILQNKHLHGMFFCYI